MVNRRMFRPGFPDVKEPSAPRPPHNGPHNGPVPSKKPAPPEITHAENFYWVKQMQSHTPMAVVLEDGEVLRGTVEWYDRDCIKLTRQGSPNLLIFKRVIKYVHKDGEESAQGGDHLLQRLGPRERPGVDVTEDRLHDLRDIGDLDLLVVDLCGGAKREVLHEEKINFVAIGLVFERFAPVPLNQSAQSTLAGVERGHLKKVAQLMHHDPLIHGIEPSLHFAEELDVGFFR